MIINISHLSNYQSWICHHNFGLVLCNNEMPSNRFQETMWALLAIRRRPGNSHKTATRAIRIRRRLGQVARVQKPNSTQSLFNLACRSFCFESLSFSVVFCFQSLSFSVLPSSILIFVLVFITYGLAIGVRSHKFASSWMANIYPCVHIVRMLLSKHRPEQNPKTSHGTCCHATNRQISN